MDHFTNSSRTVRMMIVPFSNIARHALKRRHGMIGSFVCASLCLLSVGCGQSFKAREKMVVTVPVPTHGLRIEGEVGDVTIVADPNATVLRADVTKIARAHIQSLADEAVSSLKVTFEPKGDQPATVFGLVDLASQRRGVSYAVRWHVTGPPGLAVEVRNSVGDVRVMGFWGPVAVDGGVGDVVVEMEKTEQSSGRPVQIQTDVGNIRAVGAVGGLSAANNVGNISASAGGPIDMKASTGLLSLKLLRASSDSVQMRTSVGSARIALPPHWQGKLMAETDIGSISVRLGKLNMQNVVQSGRHFSASVAGADKPIIDVSTDVGDVTITAE